MFLKTRNHFSRSFEGFAVYIDCIPLRYHFAVNETRNTSISEQSNIHQPENRHLEVLHELLTLIKYCVKTMNKMAVYIYQT